MYKQFYEHNILFTIYKRDKKYDVYDNVIFHIF